MGCIQCGQPCGLINVAMPIMFSLGHMVRYLNIYPMPVRNSRKIEREIIRSHLTSSDIIIRKRARRRLSQHGAENVDFINELLNSDSFRLELGALEAIRHMEQRHIQVISGDLDRQRIQVLAESQNSTLRQSATNILDLLDTIN